jgi:hypothetical protein
MSRRTSRPAAAHSRRPNLPAGDKAASLQRPRPRPSKWFLAAIVLMQAVWIGFLAAMALLG